MPDLVTLHEEDLMTRPGAGRDDEELEAYYDSLLELLATIPARASATHLLHCVLLSTPLGHMLAAARDDALCLLEYTDRRMLETQLKRLLRVGGSAVTSSNVVLDHTQRELDAYFAGSLRAFSVPLAPAGTPFQRKAWQLLREIPYGTTRSYGEQARALGQPSATRAVARANGDNPIAIIVPCHRVVGSDGSLTGYGGGLWRKRWLLDHERGDVLPL